MDHSLTATLEKVVEQPLAYDGDQLHEEGAETVHERELRTLECSCGKTFDSEQVALTHIETAQSRLKPGVVLEITDKMRNDGTIETGVKENGFVVRDLRGRYYTGIEVEDGGYIVFGLSGQEKVRGNNEPRMKTRRVYVVTANSYHIESLPGDPAEAAREHEYARELRDYVDEHGDSIATGYTPANRTDSVEDAVEETWKWYAPA